VSREPSTLKVLTLAALALLVAGLILLGPRWWERRKVEAELLAAFNTGDRMQRLREEARIRDERRADAVPIAASLLDNPDGKIRQGAASFLMLAHSQAVMPDDAAERLAAHLREDTQPNVRLTCAIALMQVKSPAVRDAYLMALHDSNEKVVQLACMEVADRGGPGAKEALSAVTDHPSWRVRLEACKGLIHANLADSATVAALEKLSGEPEARAYDAEIDDFEKREVEAGVDFGEHWGNTETILRQARDIARGGVKPQK
jgi:hypothetical protein